MISTSDGYGGRIPDIPARRRTDFMNIRNKMAVNKGSMIVIYTPVETRAPGVYWTRTGSRTHSVEIIR